MKSGPVTIEELRHRIDTLTPGLPDLVSRTEVTTLMLAMYLHGSVSALETPLEMFLPEARRLTALSLHDMADELIASLRSTPGGS
jgi:hypothetical protein